MLTECPVTISPPVVIVLTLVWLLSCLNVVSSLSSFTPPVDMIFVDTPLIDPGVPVCEVDPVTNPVNAPGREDPPFLNPEADVG